MHISWVLYRENLSWLRLSSLFKRTFHSEQCSPSHYQNVMSFHGGKAQYDLDDLRSGLRASSKCLQEPPRPPQNWKAFSGSEAQRIFSGCLLRWRLSPLAVLFFRLPKFCYFPTNPNWSFHARPKKHLSLLLTFYSGHSF